VRRLHSWNRAKLTWTYWCWCAYTWKATFDGIRKETRNITDILATTCMTLMLPLMW